MVNQPFECALLKITSPSITTSILLLLLSNFGQAFACQLTVRVPTDSAPPAFVKVNGQWQGMSVQIVETWLEKAGCKVQYRSLPFKRALSYLNAGDIDVMLHLSKNPQREKHYHFIGPMAYEQLMMYTLSDNGKNINSLKDVVASKEPIATLRGLFYGKEFYELMENNPAFKKRVIAVDHVSQLVALLERKRVIGFLFNSFYGRSHDKVSKLLTHIDSKAVLLSKSPVYFALSKKSISPNQLKLLELSFEQVKTHPKVRQVLEYHSQ